MVERRKRLEESARVLRQRLSDLERRPVQEVERPMWEVAIRAVRETLTEVGHELARIAAAA